MPQQPTQDYYYSVACSASSTSPTNMPEYYHQMQPPPLAALPSWSPYAGPLLAGSAFAADSSSSSDMGLSSERFDVHVWNQGLLSNGPYRENFLNLLATKNVTPEMFDDVPAACGLNTAGRCMGSSVSPVKYETASTPLYLGSGVLQGSMASSYVPCYDHEVNEGNQLEGSGAPMASFLQQISAHGAGIHTSPNYSDMGIDQKICLEDRVMEAPFCLRSLPDLGSFSGYRSPKGLMYVKPYMRCADMSDVSRQEQEILSARTSSSGSGAGSDRKKRQHEERPEGAIKKSKPEASTTSSPKQHAPKVKLGDKITALQQIVSPFGKTDTASVLFETIKYIKFLHQQVQILSEPYMTASRSKCNVPWGDAGTKEAEVEHDLRDRGLCLVPVSWTPEVWRDNSAADYWTMAYRGGLYR